MALFWLRRYLTNRTRVFNGNMNSNILPVTVVYLYMNWTKSYMISLYMHCTRSCIIYFCRHCQILYHSSFSCRVTDLQNRVATQCLQMHGGWGYMMEYPIAKAFVDARVQPIYGGSNEIMKELIARTIIADK